MHCSYRSFVLACVGFAGVACAKSGLFVGGGVSSIQPLTTKPAVFGEETIAPDSGIAQTDFASKGYSMGLYGSAGYRFQPSSFGKYFVEVELMGRTAHANLKNNTVIDTPAGPQQLVATVGLKQKETLGLILKGGMLFSDNWSGYLQGGLMRSEIEVRVTGNQVTIGGAGAGGVGVSSSMSKKVLGLRLGGGASYQVPSCPPLSLRLDYGFERYQKFSTGSLQAWSDTGNTDFWVSLKPQLSYHVLSLGLVYQF